jgi:hypothetical protein
MTEIAPQPSAQEAPTSERSRVGLWIGVGAAGVIVLAALITLVLVVSIGILGGTPLPSSDTSKTLLDSSDLADVVGAKIVSGRDTETRRYSLEQYVRENPVSSRDSVSPSRCADNLEGWMAWAALDTPTYRGWKSDEVFAAENIRVDAVADYGDDIQEARHFATVAAATRFMQVQRAWYRDCATVTYSDPGGSAADDATYAFSPVPVSLGVDAIVEGSTDRGKDVAPHLIDAYLRNRNIVYVTEIVTTKSPANGLDRVSLALLNAAAKNLRDLH